MARTTKTDRAENFGKNDDQLKEFAQGEDVGHGPNHDCPLCRKNRQALKLANLHASDIKGLEGGKAPTEAIIDQPTNPDLRDGVSPASSDPNDKPVDQVIQQMLSDNPQVFGEGTALTPAPSSAPATHFTPEDIAFTDEQDHRDHRIAQKHMRILHLCTALDDALRAALQKRGMDPELVDSYDLDFGEAIVGAGGRYQLMAGFIPDDRHWHCEVGFAAERAHVQHPDRTIAIRLATLLAIDPKAAAPLNSQFLQLLQEEQPHANVRHWVGTGVQS